MSQGESLTVGVDARQAQIAPSAVRYYESIGLLPQAERVGGWRRFAPSVLDRLRLIRVASASGFSLDEVRQLLDAVDADTATGPAALAELARAKLPVLEAALARHRLLVDIMRRAAACECPTLAECTALAQAGGVVPPR